MIENFVKKDKHQKNSKKRLIFTLVGVVGVCLILFFAIGYFFIFLPAHALETQAKEIITTATKVRDAFKENDIDKVGIELKNLQKKYDGVQDTAKKLYWLTYVPFLSLYGSDLKNVVSAGDEIIQSLLIAEESVAPYADLIGFKKGGVGFFEQPADQRIQTAVLTLDKVVVKADDIAGHIDKARKEIAQIDENRYPQKLGKSEVRSTIKKTKEQFEVFATLFVESKSFFKKLPAILGAEKELTYLVLFQNDKELRPTGGFLTAYAIFKIKNGKFQIKRSEDIYSLDESIAQHPKAPREILDYHKGVSVLNIRDSNLSPDFVTSLGMFNSLYEKSSRKIAYDGVITVDTQVLVDALNVLGDTEADGIVFSAKNDKRCNCPQVIYQLFDMVDRPVNYVKENRKGILGDLLYVLTQKAFSFSPKQYWGRLSQDMFKNLQEKHILMYFKEADIQKAVEQINFAGRIRDYKGDYLHINDTNFAGAKSNLFVQHTVVSHTNIKSDGTVERTLKIEYKNPAPHSDCNLERGGLCLNATLRNWIRVYVPKGSKLMNFQGSEKKVNTYEDLSKTVYEGFVSVQPKGKSTLFITYTLPFKVSNKNEYSLYIQKQPGTQGHDYVIKINEIEKDAFKLTTDKKLSNKKT